MRGVKKLHVFLFLASVAVLMMAFTGGAFAAEKIMVYHAGSLAAPLAKIEALYEAANPGVDVLRESGGSNALSRKITDLGGGCDVFLSADYMVIEKLLRPAGADWNVAFASNAIVLMYGPKSKYNKEINSKNWTEVMMRPDVRWGHSEPDADPCGYRSLLVIQLAEKYYGDKDLYKRALKDPLRGIRQKAIELVAMVESGTMDYAFEYKSVAVQHKLDYVELPPEINLMDPARAKEYSTVSIELMGSEPGKKLNVVGEPIVYGFTIPKTAPNPKGAMNFVKFLLDPKGGLAVFQEMGQDVVGPSAVGDNSKIPAEITKMLKK